VLDRQDLTGIDRGGMASEQVTDLLHRYRNHFPELEAEAERLWKEAHLEGRISSGPWRVIWRRSTA